MSQQTNAKIDAAPPCEFQQYPLDNMDAVVIGDALTKRNIIGRFARKLLSEPYVGKAQTNAAFLTQSVPNNARDVSRRIMRECFKSPTIPIQSRERERELCVSLKSGSGPRWARMAANLWVDGKTDSYDMGYDHTAPQTVSVDVKLPWDICATVTNIAYETDGLSITETYKYEYDSGKPNVTFNAKRSAFETFIGTLRTELGSETIKMIEIVEKSVESGW